MKNIYAARIRAARAYAGMRQSELADALGHGAKTQITRENDDGDPPRRAELIAIAHVCDVPLWFLDEGFGGAARYAELDDAIEGVTRLAEVSRSADEPIRPAGRSGRAQPGSARGRAARRSNAR